MHGDNLNKPNIHNVNITNHNNNVGPKNSKNLVLFLSDLCVIDVFVFLFLVMGTNAV